MTKRFWQRLVLALAFATTVTVPASAQFWERPFWERQQPPQQQQNPPRDYFPFRFFGGDRGPPSYPFGQSARPSAPVVDSSKAPPPHKVETPPTSTILVIGDSLADWLGYGLEEAFSDTPEIGIVRKIKPTSGLVRYEARNESIEWWQATKDLLATDKPNAIVVMLGLNDRQSLRERASRAGTHNGEQAPQSGAETAEQPATSSGDVQRTTPSGSYEFHTDKWNELYGKRVDEMIAVLKSKGVPVVWVGLPAIRGAHATSDMSYLDEIFRARAEKAGITYVDVWDGFVDENGRYVVQGPDFEGQTRRLRSGDGVHFTKAGAVKLAHYVEHELRRLMSNHVVPVALPAPEEHSAPNAAVVGRPAIGPIVPLNAAIGGEGSLLGADGRIDPAKADPIVKRVLSRGDAIVAPAGRADDFSWPRADVGSDGGPHAAIDAGPVRQPPIASASSALPSAGKSDNRMVPGTDAVGGPQAVIQSTPDSVPASTTIAVPVPSAKDGDDRSDVKKLPNVGGTQAASQATTPVPHARRHHPRTNLDGAPMRPPLPVGPAATNTR